MIYVTQGHEKGVGLEVFLKSFICLPKAVQSEFILIVYKESLITTLTSTNLEFTINSNVLSISSSQIRLIFPSGNYLKNFQSTACLLQCLETITANDILLTLPTSKDQLIYDGNQKNGYTEFLRDYFKKPDLTMTFMASDFSVALCSDHIPLSEVSKSLSSNIITNRITHAIQSLKSLRDFSEVIISGINPHAGEGGLIGHEDKEVSNAIVKLRDLFPSLIFTGPLPGDTVYFQKKRSSQLFVFMYHDQGLGVFKSNYGLVGANITCGLPFLRVSVDHGTAFDLFGENRANYQGCLFTLKLLINALPSKKGTDL